MKIKENDWWCRIVDNAYMIHKRKLTNEERIQTRKELAEDMRQLASWIEKGGELPEELGTDRDYQDSAF